MITRVRKVAWGFSLIEVMVSASMFFVGLTAVLSSYGMASRLLAHHRNVTHAVALCEGAMEDLIQRYPGDDALSIGGHVGARYDSTGKLTSGAGKYAVTWVVAAYEKLAKVRTLTATVTWDEEGKAATLKLTTWRL